MTPLLSQAFSKAGVLPEALQEQLAQQLLDDIEAELKWDRTLEAPQEALSKLANKVAADRKAGRIKKMVFDEP